ncbi:MAG: hypothetical protein CM15mV73_510 [Caudoviricetes sp.]|nr:MAG: hypothetical protein CM15mV73_510 [Caudoviricetes sp.]
MGFLVKRTPQECGRPDFSGRGHRIMFGLAQHQNQKVYNLSFNVTETQSDEAKNLS